MYYYILLTDCQKIESKTNSLISPWIQVPEILFPHQSHPREEHIHSFFIILSSTAILTTVILSLYLSVWVTRSTHVLATNTLTPSIFSRHPHQNNLYLLPHCTKKTYNPSWSISSPVPKQHWPFYCLNTLTTSHAQPVSKSTFQIATLKTQPCSAVYHTLAIIDTTLCVGTVLCYSRSEVPISCLL